MKYTPGPWAFRESKRFPTIAINGDKGSVRVANTYGELDWQRQIANARLIAAAPELLEALEAARFELAGLVNQFGLGFRKPTEHPIIKRIDAAIAKAREE